MVGRGVFGEIEKVLLDPQIQKAVSSRRVSEVSSRRSIMSSNRSGRGDCSVVSSGFSGAAPVSFLASSHGQEALSSASQPTGPTTPVLVTHDASTRTPHPVVSPRQNISAKTSSDTRITQTALEVRHQHQMIVASASPASPSRGHHKPPQLYTAQPPKLSFPKLSAPKLSTPKLTSRGITTSWPSMTARSAQPTNFQPGTHDQFIVPSRQNTNVRLTAPPLTTTGVVPANVRGAPTNLGGFNYVENVPNILPNINFRDTNLRLLSSSTTFAPVPAPTMPGAALRSFPTMGIMPTVCEEVSHQSSAFVQRSDGGSSSYVPTVEVCSSLESSLVGGLQRVCVKKCTTNINFLCKGFLVGMEGGGGGDADGGRSGGGGGGGGGGINSFLIDYTKS